MVDKVFPIKFETTGTGSQTDFEPTEVDPTEDYVAAKGLSINASDDLLVHEKDGEIAVKDPTYGDKKISEWSQINHKLINEMVHTVNEDSVVQFTRTSGKVSNVTWTSTVTAQTIREIDYIRTAGKLSQVITKQYDESGILIETYTETIARVGGKMQSITGVIS